MAKLNLGCGLYYKPGYVNIDRYEESVSDMRADIRHLPYNNNSVEEIEASHVLEHFDSIILPYLLSEWYRILKPQGELHIETPHLVKTVKKLRFRSYSNQKNTLRFLFGIDLPGNIHKFGFTPSFLKKTLELVGYGKIKQEKPLSFRTEKSLRIKAVKPAEVSFFDKTLFLTRFRWKILANFRNPDILLLEAIEYNCIDPLNKILPENVKLFFNTETIISTCADFALVNPKVAKIFLSLFPKDKCKEINTEVFDFMQSQNFPSLFLANWIKWKKRPTENIISIARFHLHWSKKIERLMTTKNNSEENFSYLLSLPKEEVEYFSLEVSNLCSIKLTNQGIKSFSKNNLKKASQMFLDALKYDPTNGLTYWNLARLSIQLNERNEKIKQYYMLAATNIGNKKRKKDIKQEMRDYLRNEGTFNKIDPIQIRL